MSCPYLASLDEEARELVLHAASHGQPHLRLQVEDDSIAPSASSAFAAIATTNRRRSLLVSSLSSVELSSEGASRPSAPSTPAGALTAEATPSPSTSPQSALPQLGLHSGPRLPQFWELTRPNLEFCPKLKRRDLRKLGRPFTLAEVREHRYKDDCWIAVDGSVYDITEHLVDHPGWETGVGVSTVLSILAHAGSECSQEFHQIHAPYPKAYSQLRAFYIGELAED